MRALFLILFLSASTAFATMPTGTVTRSVTVNTNGVLIGDSTNFAAANGLATVTALSGYAPTGELAAVSNLAANGQTAYGWGNHGTNNYLTQGATGAVFSGNVSIESVTNSSTSVVFRVAIELPAGTYLLSDSYVKMSGLPGMPVWSGYLWNSNGHVMVSP